MILVGFILLSFFYFIFKTKNEFFLIKHDVFEVFSFGILKSIFAVVVLNIFFSYGMLYFSDFVLNISSNYNLFNSAFAGGLIATVIISPISEELIFRGVFLNRLKLAVPLTFAILISSLLFAALHVITLYHNTRRQVLCARIFPRFIII